MLVAKPNSTFVRLWLESYRDYRPSMWYYNAGVYPTESILKPCPGLVHREKLRFGVHNLAKELYGETDWDGWKEAFFREKCNATSLLRLQLYRKEQTFKLLLK